METLSRPQKSPYPIKFITNYVPRINPDKRALLTSLKIRRTKNKSDLIKSERSVGKGPRAYYFEIDRISYKNSCDSSPGRVGWSVNLSGVACPSRAQTFVSDMRRVENRVTNLHRSGFHSPLTNAAL